MNVAHAAQANPLLHRDRIAALGIAACNQTASTASAPAAGPSSRTSAFAEEYGEFYASRRNLPPLPSTISSIHAPERNGEDGGRMSTTDLRRVSWRDLKAFRPAYSRSDRLRLALCRR